MDGGRRRPVAIVDRQRQAAARHRTGNEANGRRHSRKDGQAGPSEQPSGRNVRRLRRRPARKSGLFRLANQCGAGRALLGCLSRAGRIRSAPMGPRGGVVTQRSAKPCTPVQFWSWPPSNPFKFQQKYHSAFVPPIRPATGLLPFVSARFLRAVFSAASTVATASSCIPGMTWLYRSSVIPTLL